MLKNNKNIMHIKINKQTVLSEIDKNILAKILSPLNTNDTESITIYTPSTKTRAYFVPEHLHMINDGVNDTDNL